MEIYNDTYCVYMHTNKINSKKYVGQTCQKPEERWRQGKGYKKCVYFYKAIKKYGWDGFEHEIIASNLTKEEADNFEKLLIDKLDLTNDKNGYNLMTGGGSGRPSEVVREKKRRTAIEKYKNPENTPMYGKHHTEEARRKISEHNRCKYSPNSKPVNQYDKEWNLIKTWDCAMQVERELGIDHSNISKCCRGKYEFLGGFRWKHID